MLVMEVCLEASHSCWLSAWATPVKRTGLRQTGPKGTKYYPKVQKLRADRACTDQPMHARASGIGEGGCDKGILQHERIASTAEAASERYWYSSTTPPSTLFSFGRRITGTGNMGFHYWPPILASFTYIGCISCIRLVRLHSIISQVKPHQGCVGALTSFRTLTQ